MRMQSKGSEVVTENRRLGLTDTAKKQLGRATPPGSTVYSVYLSRIPDGIMVRPSDVLPNEILDMELTEAQYDESGIPIQPTLLSVSQLQGLVINCLCKRL